MSAKPAIDFPAFNVISKFQPFSFWVTSACMLLIDIATLSAVYLVAVFGHYLIGSAYEVSIYLKLFPYITLLLGVFVIQGLYPGLLLHPAEEIRKVFNCVTLMFLLIGSGTFLWRNAEAYSPIFLVCWALGAPAVLLGRHFLRSIFAQRDWWGIPAVVLIAGRDAARVVRGLRRPWLGIRVKGILSDDHWLPESPDLPPVLGRLAFAPQIAEGNVAQYAIIMISQRSSKEVEHIIQHYCKGFRHVLLVPDLPGLCSLGITAREIGGDVVGFEVPQHLFHRSRGILKRAIDTAASVMMLAILSPLFLLVALLIKGTSKGPVFYKHKRYGRNAHIFHALKFRTMMQNADGVLADYLRQCPSQLSEWERDQKLKNDPRITSAGKWLRRFSIDELPQLWNVLVGDMSLVGPRPIVQEEIGRYGAGYDLYTRVLPGITGLWQVSGRNNTTYAERVALDEYYVRNWSIWLDIYILVRTFKVVLTSEGAY